MLVGGNGAGKSTYYRLFFEPTGLPFINADLLARLVFPEAPEAHSYEAALLAEQQRLKLVQAGISFCFETVFSHPSKIDFLVQAKASGYQVILVMIHLVSPQLNQARIAMRVSEGGHNVPAAKVEGRIARMLKQVKVVLPLCDLVQLYDNSSAEHPFQPIATLEQGYCRAHSASLPPWAASLLGFSGLIEPPVAKPSAPPASQAGSDAGHRQGGNR